MEDNSDESKNWVLGVDEKGLNKKLSIESRELKKNKSYGILWHETERERITGRRISQICKENIAVIQRVELK